ncbi:MAG: FG-GAP repeat domain-containing protein [Haloglomus sp.]
MAGLDPLDGPTDDPRTDTGQVLVVGAVLFALALLALATTLNAAIFTGELATRQSSVGEDRVVGYQRAAVRAIGGSVYYANYFDYASREQLADALAGRVGNWSGWASTHYAANRVLATTTRTDMTNGSYVFQAGDGQFRDANNDTDWTLVHDLDGARRFSMNVTRGSLVEPISADTLSDLTAAETFHVVADNGSATAEVFVYRQDDAVVVRVAPPDEGLLDERCSATGDHVTVAVTAGRVGGEPCSILDFPLVNGTYDLSYENGDAVSGRYGLVTDVTPPNLHNDPYTVGTTGATPHAVPAVYAVTLEITYTTDELRYTTTERVTPEAPPQNRVYGVAAGLREIVFVDPSDNGLRTIDPETGAVTAYDATGVQAIGPKKANFDGDDALEIPYVDSSGVLKVIDAANETRTVATGAAQSKTLLGVGTWGNGTFTQRTAVFYVNTTDGTLYRAWYNESADDYERQLVRKKDGDGDGIGAVAGIADYNGDGDTDIVFTDGSAHVTYVDGGTTHETDEGVGQNNGIGVGEPQDFDGDGTPRAPIVDGSNNVALLPDSGVSEDLTSSGPATKSPVAGVEWASGAGGLEVVFVGTSSGKLHYVTQSGTIVEIENAAGEPVEANDDQGVA